MTKNEFRATIKALGLNILEAAPLLGMSEAGLRNAVQNDKISTQTARCLELLVENTELKKALSGLKEFKKALELV